LRKELNELNERYAHIILEPSENSDVQTTESSFEEPVTKFENLVITSENTEEIESSKIQAESSETITTVKPVIINNTLKNVTSEVKPKEETIKVVKKSLSTTLRFSTVEVENAHEDLITCLDINKDATMLVTGSRDTSIKIWNIKTRKQIHSFGGHTSAVTCIRFWPLKFYKQCLENIVKDTNEDEGSSILSKIIIKSN
jgi:WD40 repeat protein